MTLAEITYIKRAGRPDEAYEEARKLLSQYPDDREVRLEAAWCLKNMAEATDDAARLARILKEISSLYLHQIGAFKLINSFGWNIRAALDRLRVNPEARVKAADMLFDAMRDIEFGRPHVYYTLLLDVFLRVKGPMREPWRRFKEFMDWWGFENLMTEDFSRIPTRSGNLGPSVAERAYTAYSRAVMAGLDNGTCSEREAEDFIDRLTLLNEIHPDFQYVLYHKAQLQLRLGRRREALATITPFVRRKSCGFWVWDVLGEATEDPAVKLSCCCRALTCNADPKFLGRLRIKTARLMHEAGFDSNARCEIRELQKVYAANNWNIPREAVEMVKQEWYQKAVPANSNIEFYRTHMRASEELLYMGAPEVPVIITRVNYQKGICSFITDKRVSGFFFANIEKYGFRENDIYYVRMEPPHIAGRSYKLLSARRVSDTESFTDIFYRKVEGPLRLQQGSGFGFVGDVYVGSEVLSPIFQHNTPVSGYAVLTYNIKRQSYSWRAVTLSPKLPDDLD